MNKLDSERFWSCVEKSNRCWNWKGSRMMGDYGMFYYNGKNRFAHRVAYELLVEHIPEGFQIDHFCRNKACVKPDHMDIVTTRENTQRALTGLISSAEWMIQTHCLYGHEFTEENTFIYDGLRYCLICNRDYLRRRK